MHMKMRNFLAGMRAHIHPHAIAIGFQAQGLRYLTHRTPEPGDFIRRGSGAEISDRDISALGDHQHMHRRLGRDVVEGKRMIILMYLLRRDFSTQDACEDIAVIIGAKAIDRHPI